MRAVANELAEPAIRALLTCCAVDGGPTDEQRRLIAALATGYFGLDLDLARAEALAPDAAARAFGDADEKHRLIELMIILELARHPASVAHTEMVERYAAAMGVDEQLQRLARDYVANDCVTLAADFGRFADHPAPEARLAGLDDAALASRLHDLAACPPGSLGRGFFDFYQRHALVFPGEPGGGSVTLVGHDMSHVLGGYEPNPVDEVALQAMLASATDGQRHFSSLMASLSLFEIGMLPFDNIVPKIGVLARPGAVEAFAEATRRGALCEADFGLMDHWAVVEQPLASLQRELNIVPRLA